MKRSLILNTALVSSLAAPGIVHMSAYANTLSPIIQDLHAALDVVSRELVGFIPSVQRNLTAERAAVGQTVIWEVAQEQDAYDIEASMNVPEPPDHVAVTKNLTITKARAVPFGFTGEEQRALNNSQPGYLSHQAGIFAMALRKLVNEVERDIAVEAAANASRAYGTPGVTPLVSGVGDIAQIRKILDDNGAPLSGRSLVGDTAMGANYRTNTQLTKANEAGTTMTVRDGELLNIHGISIKETAQAVNFIAGNFEGATDATGYDEGATSITVTGTGTLKAGDVIQFAGDVNKYLVKTGRTGAGVIEISEPGLRVDIPAVATEITVGDSYTANVAFTQDALLLAMRAPATVQQGDLALDRTVLTDPRSGASFEVSVWPGYRKVRMEVAAVWGAKAVKREHIAILQG